MTALFKNPRRLRFSIRSLLIAITALGVGLGVWVERARRQRRAVNEILTQPDTHVSYDFQYWRPVDVYPKSWVPQWILARTGPDLFHTVVVAYIGDPHAEEAYDAVTGSDVRRQLAALRGLRVLYLGVGLNQSEQCLAEVGKLRHLEWLYCCNATDAGVARLAKLRSLKGFYNYGSRLTDESLRALSNVPLLEDLGLQDNHFTDDGLVHVGRMRSLKRAWLDYGHSEFSDAGLLPLEGLSSLEQISLCEKSVTPDGVLRLTRAIPGLVVTVTSPP